MRSYFVCKFPDNGYVSADTVSKASRTTHFSKQEKLLLNQSNQVETFQGWKAKTVKVRRWQRWQRHGMKFLTKINSKNPSGIKHDLNQLQGRWSEAVENSCRKKSMTYIVVKQEKLGGERFVPPQIANQQRMQPQPQLILQNRNLMMIQEKNLIKGGAKTNCAKSAC